MAVVAGDVSLPSCLRMGVSAAWRLIAIGAAAIAVAISVRLYPCTPSEEDVDTVQLAALVASVLAALAIGFAFGAKTRVGSAIRLGVSALVFGMLSGALYAAWEVLAHEGSGSPDLLTLGLRVAVDVLVGGVTGLAYLVVIAPLVALGWRAVQQPTLRGADVSAALGCGLLLLMIGGASAFAQTTDLKYRWPTNGPGQLAVSCAVFAILFGGLCVSRLVLRARWLSRVSQGRDPEWRIRAATVAESMSALIRVDPHRQDGVVERTLAGSSTAYRGGDFSVPVAIVPQMRLPKS